MKINNKYEILTPSGFQDFHGIRKLQKKEYLKIKFSNNKIIVCSLTHPFIKNYKKIKAKELQLNDYIDGKNEKQIFIKEIEKINNKIELYDIFEVNNGNIFFVDDIISHNCSFISSGDSIIDAEILAWYKTTQIKKPIEKMGLDKMLWIYKYPESGHRYIIPADVSRGDAGSKSAFVVIDIDLMEIVCDYSGLMLPNHFGHFLVETAQIYNQALLIPENNNIGPMAIQAIIDDEYPNLYYTLKASDQIIDPINMPKGLLLDQLRIAGFITSGKTRHLIVEKMVQIIENKLIDIPSERLIDQLYNFKMIAGKPKADKGCNDDLVLACAIGMWHTDISLKLNCMKEQLSKAMMGATSRVTASLDTPGAQMMMAQKINSQENANYYWKMPIGNQRGSDTEYLDLYQFLVQKN